VSIVDTGQLCCPYVYRSNHYIFNAMRAVDDLGDSEPTSNVTEWQLRNLEVGGSVWKAYCQKEYSRSREPM